MSKRYLCDICHKEFPLEEVTAADLVRRGVFDLIAKSHPTWDASKHICLNDLHLFRGEYLGQLLEAEKGELTEIDQQVVKALKEHEVLTANLNTQFDRKLTTGERLADKVAAFGGSWTFIIIFGLVIVIWIALNTAAWWHHSFDPYPYILLNLILSCLAALQAPIIMMSQNRQAAKDRLQAEYDYRVNLKAELEIRMLSEKMDRLLSHQWQRLLEIQQIQMDLMEEIDSGLKLSKK